MQNLYMDLMEIVQKMPCACMQRMNFVISLHLDDIISVDRIANNDILIFTKTQSNPSYSTCKIIETLNLFNIRFNYKENIFFKFSLRMENDVAVLDKLNANGISIFSFKKHAFANRVFTLMLVYIKQSM